MTPEQEIEALKLEEEALALEAEARRRKAAPAKTTSPAEPVADAAKAFATGASRWATLGMDDEASGVMTGLLEAFSPTSLSDEGDDVLTRLEKGYRQGKTKRHCCTISRGTRTSLNGSRFGPAPRLSCSVDLLVQ